MLKSLFNTRLSLWMCLDGFYMRWIGLQFSSTWMRRFSSRKGWTMYCAYCVYWLMKPKHFRSSHHKIMRCWSFLLSHKMLPNFHVYQEFQVFLLGILSTPNIIQYDGCVCKHVISHQPPNEKLMRLTPYDSLQ